VTVVDDNSETVGTRGAPVPEMRNLVQRRKKCLFCTICYLKKVVAAAAAAVVVVVVVREGAGERIHFDDISVSDSGFWYSVAEGSYTYRKPCCEKNYARRKA
jgi:hypothetical protein